GMSAMGGSMVPLQQLPAGMRAVSDFTLNFWVIDGLTRVMFESAGLGEVGRNLAVLTVAGLVLAVAADALLVRRFREVGA
ncbi:ABC transporter permease, partial [bacterium]|nr:ABC transporter permease [bacterium]